MTIFSAKLRRPAKPGLGDPWTFLRLPIETSQELPSRSMVSVEGRFNGTPFSTTLEPDGEGGHWMRVEEDLREAAGAAVGDVVEVEIQPALVEPEPKVPSDLDEALSLHPVAMKTWEQTTAKARRDWIAWIVSGKKAETRVKRIEVAMSKLSAGNKRPCCFDRSGMYDKSLSAPVAADE